MDIIREDGLVVHTVLLNGMNYNLWKGRMKEFLKFLDKKVWYSVENGWKAPGMYLDGIECLKPMD